MDTNSYRQAQPAPSRGSSVRTVSLSADFARIVGRTLTDSRGVWLVQSGSAVEFDVRARSASVEILGGYGHMADPAFRPRYAVYLDGELLTDTTVSVPSQCAELFRGDSPRTVRVRIMLLSEANNGPVGVGKLTLDTGTDSPVTAAPAPELRIEFIGDSITCGYGVEAKECTDQFTTLTENFTKSYACIACGLLGAEYSAVCYSGHGIISGYTEGERTDQLVPPFYRNVGSLPGLDVPWDFASHRYDAVVINLGTNDASFIDQDFGARADEFAERYAEFLKTVRGCNPDSYIVCTLGVMDCLAEYPLIERAVESFRAATGDKRITCFKSTPQDPADGYGANWHPSEVTHRKAAREMADKLRAVLGLTQ